MPTSKRSPKKDTKKPGNGSKKRKSNASTKSAGVKKKTSQSKKKETKTVKSGSVKNKSTNLKRSEVTSKNSRTPQKRNSSPQSNKAKRVRSVAKEQKSFESSKKAKNSMPTKVVNEKGKTIDLTSVNANLKEDLVKGKAKEPLLKDRTIPDEQFYKGLVFIMIFFNLLGLGFLIYKQYMLVDYRSPTTLTQIGGEGSYEVCIDYCQRYARPRTGESQNRNYFEDSDRGFLIDFEYPFERQENPEINAYEFSFDDECQMLVNMIFVDANGMPIEDWLFANYTDNQWSETSDEILGAVAYKVFTRSESTSDKTFAQFGSLFVEFSYEYRSDAESCNYSNDDVVFEKFIRSFEVL